MADAGQSLADRVAIVTGAARGIGRATALAMARSGAHVVAVDVDEEAVKATADAVSALGRKGLALGADVGDLKSIDTMTRRVVDTLALWCAGGTAARSPSARRRRRRSTCA